MNIKYNKQKQEIREDPVLDGILKTKEFIQKNNTSVIGGIIAVIVVAAVVLGFNYYQKSRIANARDDFGRAMIAYSEQRYVDAIDQFRSVSENFKGSVTGIMGSYMLGNILSQQGRYDEAITWYQTVVKGKNTGFVNAEAYEGLGLCHEALKDTVSALDNYNKALKDDRIKFRHNAIRWKIALLSRNSDVTRSQAMCSAIIADTLAQDYRINAEYLMATLKK